MSDLASIAEKLRAVRAREEEFLARFAAESLFDRPILLDGVLSDLERSSGTCGMEGNWKSVLDCPDRNSNRRI
jgi:hypothetical protein